MSIRLSAPKSGSSRDGDVALLTCVGFGNSLDSSGNPGSSPSTQEPGLFQGQRGASAFPAFQNRDLGWLKELEERDSDGS